MAYPETTSIQRSNDSNIAYLFGNAFRVGPVTQTDGTLLHQISDTFVFNLSVKQLFWFTYRKGFDPIANTSYKTDRGWGCVHRSLQMMTAEALRRTQQFHTNHNEENIIKYFFDTETSGMSIHTISMTARSIGKKIGSWFCPSDAARVLEKLVSNGPVQHFPLVYHVTDQLFLHSELNLIFSKRFKEKGRFSRFPLKQPSPCAPKHILSTYSPERTIASEARNSIGQDVITIISKASSRTNETNDIVTQSSDECSTSCVSAVSSANSSAPLPPTLSGMTARSPLHTMDKSFNSSFTTHFPSDDSRHRSHPQENSNEWVMADLEDEEGDWENISIQTTPYLSSRSTLVSAPAFITSDLLSPFHPPSEPGVPTPSPTAHLMRNTRPIKIAEIARSPQTNAKQLPSEPTLQSPVVPSHVKKSNFSVRTHAVPDSPLSRPLGLTIDSAEFIDSPLNESVLHQYPSTHSSRSTSCIVLIPIRLGLFTVDPILFSSLLECLHHPTSLGIIGGKPRNSLWFVGHQGNELFYLDPHTTQPATKDLSTLNINTYHVQSIERIAIDKIDPSMMLCFLIRNSAEYAQFCQLVHIMPSPIFSVQESR